MTFFVVGCAGEATINKPVMEVADQFSTRSAASSITVSDARWWAAFGDNDLDQVVEIGLAQNLDIRKAVARIQQARGLYGAAGYPASGAVRIGEGKISHDSDAQETVSAGFARAEASWRVDLFGALANERLAGRRNLDAAYEDADIARLTLITDVISAYIDLRFAQETIRITKRVNQSREHTLAETQKMATAGEVPEISVAQAEALLASSRASLPELEIAFITSYNRIIALLGTTDLPLSKNFDRKAPQPLPNTTVVKTGIPADLIRNRPDIKRAEHQLASALAGVGVKDAEMYPSVVLTGNITANANSSGPEINAGFFRVGFDLPLFDRPTRKAKVVAAQGVAEEKRAEWEKQVVTSVEEVRTGIFSLERHTQATQQAEVALKAARKVLDLARKGFVSGDSNFLLLQDAERSFLNAEMALALDRRNVSVDYVRLNVALGGTYAPHLDQRVASSE